MAAASISNAWLRCGDGFQSTSVLEVKCWLASRCKKEKPTGNVVSMLD